jgi:hypothetical protein
MDEENLRQEALRLVMSNNLQEMTDLIASYGQPWKDAGQELVDYLTNGLTDGKQKIIDTLNDLVSGMSDAVQTQIGLITAGLPSVTPQSFTIEMNNTIIREEADVQKVAAALYNKMQQAGN